MNSLPKSHFLQITVRKDGLYIENKNGKNIFWDVTSFRPDPRDLLTLNKKYDGQVTFDYENLSLGKLIYFPRRIKITDDFGTKDFVNVR